MTVEDHRSAAERRVTRADGCRPQLCSADELHKLEAEVQAWRHELSVLREQRTAFEAGSRTSETLHALASLDVRKHKLIWYDPPLR